MTLKFTLLLEQLSCFFKSNVLLLNSNFRLLMLSLECGSFAFVNAFLLAIFYLNQSMNLIIISILSSFIIYCSLSFSLGISSYYSLSSCKGIECSTLLISFLNLPSYFCLRFSLTPTISIDSVSSNQLYCILNISLAFVFAIS